MPRFLLRHLKPVKSKKRSLSGGASHCCEKHVFKENIAFLIETIAFLLYRGSSFIAGAFHCSFTVNFETNVNFHKEITAFLLSEANLT